MKLSVLQPELNKVLKTALPVVPNRPTLEILSNFLLATEGGRLKISATNLEQAITVYTDARVEVDGSVTVSARLLSNFVDSLPAEQISFEVKDRKLHLKCGGMKSNLLTVDAKNYPPIPKPSGDRFELAPDVLGEALRRVAISVAADDIRPVLSGISFRADGKNIALAAADGYTLSVYKFDNQLKLADIIIPGKTVDILLKLIDKYEDPVSVTLQEDKNILFEFGNIALGSQLISGNFPDYKQMIPRNCTTSVTADTAALLRTVRTASMFASGACVRLIIAQKKITVLAANNETGGFEETIEAQIDGVDSKVGMNVGNLLKVLPVLKEERVKISLNSPTSPVTFQGVGNDAHVYVAMPMFVQWEEEKVPAQK